MLTAVLVPFLGTALGAGMVLGLKIGEERTGQVMNGVAAGAMTGAAVMNLLVPGFCADGWLTVWSAVLGVALVLGSEALAGLGGRPEIVLLLAVVLHNIPEGMAVGMASDSGTMVGIALQNIPDGAVVAVPLAALGMKKSRAFLLGVLSGAVEPAAALIAAALGKSIAGAAPGMMGFAAGAMGYVVARELIPRTGKGGRVWFLLGLGMMAVLG